MNIEKEMHSSIVYLEYETGYFLGLFWRLLTCLSSIETQTVLISTSTCCITLSSAKRFLLSVFSAM